MLSLWYWQLKTRTLKWCKNQPWTRYIPHENQFVIALFAGSPIYLSDFGSAVQLLPISYSISDMLMGFIYILSFPFSNKLFFFLKTLVLSPYSSAIWHLYVLRFKSYFGHKTGENIVVFSPATLCSEFPGQTIKLFSYGRVIQRSLVWVLG